MGSGENFKNHSTQNGFNKTTSVHDNFQEDLHSQAVFMFDGFSGMVSRKRRFF